MSADRFEFTEDHVKEYDLLPFSEVHSFLDICVEKKLFERVGESQCYRWTHDRVKELIYDEMHDSERKEVHQMLATMYFGTETEQQLEDLSWTKFHLGVEKDRFIEGSHHFERVAELAPSSDIEFRRKSVILKTLVGDVHSSTYSWEAATSVFLSCMEAVRSIVRNTRINPWADNVWKDLVFHIHIGYMKCLQAVDRFLPDMDLGHDAELRRIAREHPDIYRSWDDGKFTDLDPLFFFYLSYEHLHDLKARMSLISLRLDQIAGSSMWDIAFKYLDTMKVWQLFAPDLQTGMTVLKSLANSIPNEPLPETAADSLAMLVEQLESMSDEDILSLSPVQDENIAFVFPFLGNLITPSMTTSTRRIWVVLALAINLTLEYGYSSQCSPIFAGLSVLLTCDEILVGRIRKVTSLSDVSDNSMVVRSARFAYLSNEILKRHSFTDEEKIKALCHIHYYPGQLFWSAEEMEEFVYKVTDFRGRVRTRNIGEGALFTILLLQKVSVMPSLSYINEHIKKVKEMEIFKKTINTASWLGFETMTRFVHALEGKTMGPLSLLYYVSEPPFWDFSGSTLVTHAVDAFTCVLGVIFGRENEVLGRANRPQTQHPRAMTYLCRSIWTSVVQLRCLKKDEVYKIRNTAEITVNGYINKMIGRPVQKAEAEKLVVIPSVEETVAVLRRCAIANPQVYKPYLLFLEAERYRAGKKFHKAISKYMEAGTCAHSSNAHLLSAMSMESCSYLMREGGDLETASLVLQKSILAYRGIGAVAKAERLMTEFPVLYSSPMIRFHTNDTEKQTDSTMPSKTKISHFALMFGRSIVNDSDASLDQFLTHVVDISNAVAEAFILLPEVHEDKKNVLIWEQAKEKMGAECPRYKKWLECCGENIMSLQGYVGLELILEVVRSTRQSIWMRDCHLWTDEFLDQVEVSRVSNDTLRSGFFDDNKDIHSAYCLPICSEAKLLGLLYLESNKEFSPSAIHLVGCAIREASFLFVWLADYRRLKIKMKNLAKDLDEQESEIAESKIKMRLLTVISHEIRTPLNGIVGMAESLEYTSLTDEQKNTVQIIRQCGNTLINHVNNLLDFNKLEAGQMQLTEQPFELTEVIESAISNVRHAAQKKRVELFYCIHSEVPRHLIGDKLRIHQVVTNLIANSMKFTEHGEVTVSVTTPGVKENRTLDLLIRVHDTGIGISQTAAETIFHPFTQANMKVSRQYEGTGLGLSISRALMNLMHGSLVLESTSTVGGQNHSCFLAQLPVRVSQEARNGPITSLLTAKSLLVYNPGNLSTRELLCSLLNGWGADATSVNSLDDAVLMMKQSSQLPYAAVLNYASFPSAKDMIAMKKMKMIANAKGSKLPIVACSFDKINSVDCDVGLLKPFWPSELKKALEGLIGGDVSSGKTEPADKLKKSGFAEKHPLRILLVEDNMMNQTVAKRLLSVLGYKSTVETAINGVECLSKVRDSLARNAPFDVILMDLQMPLMDGFQATSIIRSDKDIQPQPWIIAVTADAMQEDRKRCLSSGMDDFVPKPISVESLQNAILKCNMD